MTLESNLWRWLSAARNELAPGLHMERVENLVGAGTPDVEGFLYCRNTLLVTSPVRAQFWLELKSKERPARSSTPIRFPLEKRAAQIEFMRRRWELGGNAFWLLQIGSGAERRLYLAAGDLGERLKQGMSESEIAVEVATYGALSPKATPGEVILWAAQCRTKLSRIMR